MTYPATAPELELPELDGKTSKMYRGGKICLTIHFKPLWSKNVPHFGIAHALCLGLGPWMVRSSIRSSPYPNPAHFHPLISHRAGLISVSLQRRQHCEDNPDWTVRARPLQAKIK